MNQPTFKFLTPLLLSIFSIIGCNDEKTTTKGAPTEADVKATITVFQQRYSEIPVDITFHDIKFDAAREMTDYDRRNTRLFGDKIYPVKVKYTVTGSMAGVPNTSTIDMVYDFAKAEFGTWDAINH